MNEYGGETGRSSGAEKKRSEYGGGEYGGSVESRKQSEYGGSVEPRKQSEYGGSVEPRKQSEYGGSVDGDRSSRKDYGIERSKWDDRRSPEPVTKYR
jgi:hypothetical protein